LFEDKTHQKLQLQTFSLSSHALILYFPFGHFHQSESDSHVYYRDDTNRKLEEPIKSIRNNKLANTNSLTRRDREDTRHGGGVGIYCREELSCIQLSNPSDSCHETIWLWCRPRGLPRTYSCIILAQYTIPKVLATDVN